jgi:hypothetical protein
MIRVVRSKVRLTSCLLAVCLAGLPLAACGSSPQASSPVATPTDAPPIADPEVTLGWPLPKQAGIFNWGEGREEPQAIVSIGALEIPNGGFNAAVSIVWQSWGGPTAIGHGRLWHSEPGANGCNSLGCHVIVCGNPCQIGHVVVVAFMRGTCYGHREYGAVEWYSPSMGQKFESRISDVPVSRATRTYCGRSNPNNI